MSDATVGYAWTCKLVDGYLVEWLFTLMVYGDSVEQ